ncbi:MAG: hypothetical protein AAFQ44_00165 [Pseudomonadota bacterium]
MLDDQRSKRARARLGGSVTDLISAEASPPQSVLAGVKQATAAPGTGDPALPSARSDCDPTPSRISPSFCCAPRIAPLGFRAGRTSPLFGPRTITSTILSTILRALFSSPSLLIVPVAVVAPIAIVQKAIVRGIGSKTWRRLSSNIIVANRWTLRTADACDASLGYF